LLPHPAGKLQNFFGILLHFQIGIDNLNFGNTFPAGQGTAALTGGKTRRSISVFRYVWDFLVFAFPCASLLFLNGENSHGASLGADAAGNTLAGLCVPSGGHDHYLHGAGLYALAAANALALVDHVDALGILGNSAFRTGAGAFAAHDTVLHLRLTIRLGNDADAAQIRVKLLIKRLGAGPDAAQARLAGIGFTDYQFFHIRMASCR
jgi:hypothetical protein